MSKLKTTKRSMNDTDQLGILQQKTQSPTNFASAKLHKSSGQTLLQPVHVTSQLGPCVLHGVMLINRGVGAVVVVVVGR